MDLLPLFVNLAQRRVLLVGGGPVAAAKLRQLLAVGADVSVIAPQVCEEIAQRGRLESARGPHVSVERRPFDRRDLDGVWLVVSAATREVNAVVAAEAERRHILVNAVDDPANATAYLGGVIRRGDVTVAISTSGAAPGLTALLRQGIDALLPRDLERWVDTAKEARRAWRRDLVPMAARRPLLLAALNRLYR